MIKISVTNDRRSKYMILRYITEPTTGEQTFGYGIYDVNALDAAIHLERAGVPYEDISLTMVQLRTGGALDAELQTSDDYLYLKRFDKLTLQ